MQNLLQRRQTHSCVTDKCPLSLVARRFGGRFRVFCRLWLDVRRTRFFWSRVRAPWNSIRTNRRMYRRQSRVCYIMSTKHVANMNDHGIKSIRTPLLLGFDHTPLLLLPKSIIFLLGSQKGHQIQIFWKRNIIIQLLQTMRERYQGYFGSLLESL